MTPWQVGQFTVHTAWFEFHNVHSVAKSELVLTFFLLLIGLYVQFSAPLDIFS